MDQSTCAPTSSTSTPLGPRPAFPAQAPAIQHLSHDLPHIPTAVSAPVHLTRDQLDREIAAAKQHEPYLLGYGTLQSNAAFGGAS